MENKYRDAQPDNIERVRGLVTLSLQQDVFIRFLPSVCREPYKEEVERQRGWMTPRKQAF